MTTPVRVAWIGFAALVIVAIIGLFAKSAPTDSINANKNTGPVAVTSGNNSPVFQVGSILVDNSVHNSVTNPLPKPYIISTNLISINVPDGDSYKTQFEIQVGHAQGEMKIMHQGPANVFKGTSATAGSSLSLITTGDQIQGKYFLLSLWTHEKVKDSDFMFLVERVPNQ